jgi:hypothetical protein
MANKETIKKYIEAGVVVMPVDKSKRPILGGWQNLTIADCQKPDFISYWDNPDNKVGLLCGSVGNIEALDFDLKYSIDPELFNNYCAEIKKESPDLLNKLTIQRTISGGYHFIYKCDKIERNLKLARRPATHDEMLKDNSKVFVLIESRGIGGMVVIAPSQGYTLLRNTFENIPTITSEERDLLFTVARSFNTYDLPHTKPAQYSSEIKGESIFAEYNSDTQAGIDLLELHGWSIIRTKGNDIHFKRPGHTSALHSAYYHTNSNIFVAFTTSSDFITEKGYSNSGMLHIFEGHNGDWAKTAKLLRDMGYGGREYHSPNRVEKVYQDEEKGVKIEKNEEGSTVYKYIEDSKNYIDYLEKSRTGTLEKGLTTGSRWLDNHFRFKRGNFAVTLAFPNVGKSFFWWFLCAVTNREHKWRWLIFSPENKTGQVIKKLIEILAEKNIEALSTLEVNEYRLYIDDNFKFINSDQSYNAKDILKIAEEYNQHWKFDGILIDPYNSLMIPDKNNAHQYHYEVVTLMRSFSNRTGIYVSLNVHPNTSAGRNKDSDGNSKTPHPADAEGGIMFLNRCDEFLVLERLVNDPQQFRQTYVHVKKVKDWESGGKPTPNDTPVRLTLMDGVSFVDDNQVRLLSGRLYYEKEEAPKPPPTPLTPNTDFDSPFPSTEPLPF